MLNLAECKILQKLVSGLLGWGLGILRTGLY